MFLKILFNNLCQVVQLMQGCFYGFRLLLNQSDIVQFNITLRDFELLNENMLMYQNMWLVEC